MGFIAKSRSRLIFAAGLIVAGYFVFTAASGVIHNHQLAQQRSESAAQVSRLEEKQKYLEAVRNYVASDAYVEQEARRQLGYVRDGEIPFVVISPAPKESSQPTGEWWQRLFPR
ncbi:MAG: septum formation initiator family protein [Tepidiformaceae bacterium]